MDEVEPGYSDSTYVRMLCQNVFHWTKDTLDKPDIDGS